MRPCSLAWSLVLAVLGAACGGRTTGDDGADGTSGGSAGTVSDGPAPTSTVGATGQGSQTGGGTGDSGDGPADSGDSTGGGPPPACVDDAECALVDECNQCTAVYAGAGGAPGSHPGSHAGSVSGIAPVFVGDRPAGFDIGQVCEFTQCDLWDDPVPQCRYGHCVLSKLRCGTPMCDSLPPDCAPPFVPLIDAAGSCWTGSCGPVHLCDFVESCLDCNDGTVCVTLEGQTQPTCERPPMECDGTAECDCAGAALCGEAACAVVDGGIVCGG